MSINALGTNIYRNQFERSNESKVNKQSSNIFQSAKSTKPTIFKNGSDDGKISLASKAKNFFKGIGFTLKKAVKSLTNPKVLACIALCAIPGVGPIAAVAFGTMGAIHGTKTLVQGIKTAHNASSDYEAELAWQNIGSGTFQVATSTVAAKTGLKVIKSQGGLSQTISIAEKSIGKTGHGIKVAGKGARRVGTTAKNSYQLNKLFGNGAKDSIYGAIKDSFAHIKGSSYAKSIKNCIGDTKAAGSLVKEAVQSGVKLTVALKDTAEALGISTQNVVTATSVSGVKAITDGTSRTKMGVLGLLANDLCA